MGYAGAHVKSHDVAARVDPPGLRGGSAGEINRGEGGTLSKYVQCSAQREAKREQVKAPLSSHMFLYSQVGAECARMDNKYCASPLRQSQQKAMVLAGARVDSHDVAAGVY